MSGSLGQSPDLTGEAERKARETASSLGQKAQEAASNLGQRAQGMASQAGQKAQELASSATGQAEKAVSNVGERMSTMAGTLRERAPHEGMLGSAASAVADRLEASGSYLQEHGLSGMRGDLETVVRRNPLPAIFVCLGVGCLLGMLWSKR